MSISPFDAGDNPAHSNSHLYATAGRMVDLQTGELSFGDFGTLLDALFGAATAERSAWTCKESHISPSFVSFGL